jgi:hypothetical protein
MSVGKVEHVMEAGRAARRAVDVAATARADEGIV